MFFTHFTRYISRKIKFLRRIFYQKVYGSRLILKYTIRYDCQLGCRYQSWHYLRKTISTKITRGPTNVGNMSNDSLALILYRKNIKTEEKLLLVFITACANQRNPVPVMDTNVNFGSTSHYSHAFLMGLAITGTLWRNRVQGSRNYKENDLFLL